jgi:hypothetical protein
MLVAQLFVIGLLVLANLRLARTDPDVVVVAPDGKSTYVERSVAGDALIRFLAEQKHQPSDVTVVHFTQTFLQASLAVNSSTIDEMWPRALSMMGASLRARLERESAAQKLLETYRLAQVRTELAFEEIALVERTQALMHVRVQLSRRKSRLLDGAPTFTDGVRTELVLRTVPRSPDRPDGLEVAEWRVAVAGADAGTPSPEVQP